MLAGHIFKVLRNRNKQRKPSFLIQMKESDLTKLIILAGIGASMTANLLFNRHGFGVRDIVLPTKPHDGLIGLSVKMAGVTLNDCIIDSGSRRRRLQTQMQ